MSMPLRRHNEGTVIYVCVTRSLTINTSSAVCVRIIVTGSKWNSLKTVSKLVCGFEVLC
jgi:hypothetical protein